MGVLSWVVCCLALLLPAATNSAIPRDARSSGLQPVQTRDGDRAPVAVQQGRGASLGCFFGDVTPEQAFLAGLEKPRGAYVSAVLPGGPAALAGLEIDDIVLKVDGQDVTVAGMLACIVRSKTPGESLHLTVLRERRTMEIDVLLAASSAEAAIGREAAFRACASISCPACEQAVVLLGRTAGDACSACLKGLARDIAACAAARMGVSGTAQPPVDRQPAPVPTPAPTPAVQPALALDGLVLKPPRVAPGARFTIEVAYTASPDRPVTLAFSIRAEDRELLASAPEVIASGAGTPMSYTRSLVASPNPGEYRVRVRLEQDDRAVERTVTLMIAPRRP
jgi:hypothetical protein